MVRCSWRACRLYIQSSVVTLSVWMLVGCRVLSILPKLLLSATLRWNVSMINQPVYYAQAVLRYAHPWLKLPHQ
jgi:hypothetical protein